MNELETLDVRSPSPRRPVDQEAPPDRPAAWVAIREGLARGRAWCVGRPGLMATLSLLCPGTGQLAAGRTKLGLCLLSWTAFSAAFAWAALSTLDRLHATLPLLGVPFGAVGWTLVVVYALAAATHVGSVLSAAGSAPTHHHPVVAALASAVAPGWGQVLNGDRVRAGLFLGVLWVVAGAWIVSSEPVAAILNHYAPALPSWEQSLRQPIVLWSVRSTAPLLLWSLAVYDAAASAASRR